MDKYESLTVRLPKGRTRQIDYKDGQAIAIWTVTTREDRRKTFRRLWTHGQPLSIAAKCTLRAAERIGHALA
jgi:hypothetical protein